jgi:hypothetical protein
MVKIVMAVAVSLVIGLGIGWACQQQTPPTAGYPIPADSLRAWIANKDAWASSMQKWANTFNGPLNDMVDFLCAQDPSKPYCNQDPILPPSPQPCEFGSCPTQ